MPTKNASVDAIVEPYRERYREPRGATAPEKD